MQIWRYNMETLRGKHSSGAFWHDSFTKNHSVDLCRKEHLTEHIKIRRVFFLLFNLMTSWSLDPTDKQPCVSSFQSPCRDFTAANFSCRLLWVFPPSVFRLATWLWLNTFYLLRCFRCLFLYKSNSFIKTDGLFSSMTCLDECDHI